MAKRFIDGQVNIEGQDGSSAISAGYVGEVIEDRATGSIVNSPSTANSYGLTGIGVTLTPGVWLVVANISYYCSGGAGGFRIASAAGDGIVGTETYVSETVFTSVSMSGVINIASTTTYNVQLRGTASGSLKMLTTSVSGSLTDPDTSSKIFAVRIA